jgi:predicted transcriptional regulator
MTMQSKPLTQAEAVNPLPEEPADDVRLWQAEKIRAGLKAADEGRFASPEAVRAMIAKFVPNG